VQKAKNEDVVATVLSREKVGRYYRFYGARHSILQLGYLIDFEIQEDHRAFLPRMRSLSHFAFPWIFDRERMMVWQRLMQQLEIHLRETETVESFYFDALLKAAKKWHRQHPKRLAVEFYTAMLHDEGRLHPPTFCYVCENAIGEETALMSGFKPAHPTCIYAPAVPTERIVSLFETQKTTLLDDNEVHLLYSVMTKAL